VDGNYFPSIDAHSDVAKLLLENDISMTVHCIIKGDNVHQCISAASIIAKNNRDEWIAKTCAKHPEFQSRYKLLSNKGYGTKFHLEGIKNHGVTKFHRMSFKPCRLYGLK
jgi:ribonuclease HII